MTSVEIYMAVGVVLFVVGLIGSLLPRAVVRRVLAVNLMGSGVFLVLVATAAHQPEAAPLAPRVMVLVGIGVAFAVTAVVLHLLLRLAGDERERSR